MFNHILLPTDGSELSMRAVHAGIGLAKALGARISALHTTSPFYPFQMLADEITDRQRKYEETFKDDAERILHVVEKEARGAGIEYELLQRAHDNPWEGIVKVSTERGCDLIFMASHGRHGMSALLLGSETMKVLTHGKIPVLVFR